MDLNDRLLVEAILCDPPRRDLLPGLGSREPDCRALNERRALFRALSCTRHSLIRDLLMSALTEPVGRQRGSEQVTEPFSGLPEPARMAHVLLAEGWSLQTLRARLHGLKQLWEALERTAPDTWRARDVAEVLCNWHRDGHAVAEVHRAIDAARSLWASDPSGPGEERLRHFGSFLRALIEVF